MQCIFAGSRERSVGEVNGLIIVLISAPDKKTARKIATHLLENRLAACVQIFPAESAYRWKGKIENAKEFIALAKTVPENFGKIKQEVKKIHPYECPEILKIGAEANEEYENWLREEIKTD